MDWHEFHFAEQKFSMYLVTISSIFGNIVAVNTAACHTQKKWKQIEKKIFQWKGKHFDCCCHRISFFYFSNLVSHLTKLFFSAKMYVFRDETYGFRLNNGAKLIFIWEIFHQLSFGRRLIAPGQMATTQWTGKKSVAENCLVT